MPRTSPTNGTSIMTSNALLPQLDDKNASDSAIGTRLTMIRVGFGMTQAQFAKSIDVSSRSYQHYEKGSRSISAEILRRLRAVHRLDLNWVLLGRGLPREGDDAAALAQFVEELGAHLSSTQSVLPSRGMSKIVSRWWSALQGGTRIEMRDVKFWVDLMRE